MSHTTDANVRWVQMESGVMLPLRLSSGAGEPTEKDKAAVNNALRHPATAIIQPFYGAGGPYGPAASHELLRRTLNAHTATLDSFFYGAHSRAWGGNIAMLNSTYARSVLGQHLIDPDSTRTGNIQPALWFLQHVQTENTAVDLERPAFLFERILDGSVTATRALLELRERAGNGATSTGPWIMPSTGVFRINKDGLFFTEAGFSAFGASAHATLMGGSYRTQGGGAFVALAEGTVLTDAVPSGLKMWMSAPGTAYLEDYADDSDLNLIVYGNITATRLHDSGPSKLTASALVLRELSAATITSLGTPANGLGYFYVKDTDELPYFKDKDGVETALGGSASPTTTLGDLIRRGASADERLAVGSNSQVLTVVSGEPAWATPANATTLKKTSDQTTASTAYVDVTGLSFSVSANTDYAFSFYVVIQSSGTTNGYGVSINGPAAPTALSYRTEYQASAEANGTEYTASTYRHDTAYDAMPAMISTQAANTDRYVQITGRLRNGANAGTLTVRAVSETALNITVMRGSWGTYF